MHRDVRSFKGMLSHVIRIDLVFEIKPGEPHIFSGYWDKHTGRYEISSDTAREYGTAIGDTIDMALNELSRKLHKRRGT
jgi:hypothetical protein